MSNNYIETASQFVQDGVLQDCSFKNIVIAESFALPDGTAGAPSLDFVSDPDTGLYRAGANQLGISAGGVRQAVVSSTGTTIYKDANACLEVSTGSAVAVNTLRGNNFCRGPDQILDITGEASVFGRTSWRGLLVSGLLGWSVYNPQGPRAIATTATLDQATAGGQGIYVGNTIGSLSDYHGIYIADASITTACSNKFGIYIEEQKGASSNNLDIYTGGNISTLSNRGSVVSVTFSGPWTAPVVADCVLFLDGNIAKMHIPQLTGASSVDAPITSSAVTASYRPVADQTCVMAGASVNAVLLTTAYASVMATSGVLTIYKNCATADWDGTTGVVTIGPQMIQWFLA